MKKILIIEDDKNIRVELSKLLTKNKYEVDTLEDFINDFEFIDNNYDIILLDINLPNISGFEICHNIKKKISIPIIFVTSLNTEEVELKSIISGGDDFISKPYNTLLLLEKIRRAIERSNKIELTYQNVVLNLANSTIAYNGKEVELTRNEKKIMTYFFDHTKEAIKKEELLEYLWNEKDYLEENILLVNINRLRKKLEDIDLYDFIITVRGEGYKI